MDIPYMNGILKELCCRTFSVVNALIYWNVQFESPILYNHLCHFKGKKIFFLYSFGVSVHFLLIIFMY